MFNNSGETIVYKMGYMTQYDFDKIVFPCIHMKILIK